jgi:hypothetical protein
MSRIINVFCSIAIILLLASCSKKSHPSESNKATITPINGIATPAEVERSKEKEVVVKKKKVVKATPKEVFPEVITVNDSAAHKSVDGRYYYDVLGHRYWRNNKDGKYYLFNKSMYNNPDFKPQK